MTLMLSKSRYIAALQCLKRLWLAVHRPELAQTTHAQQLIFDQGRYVGDLAQGLFPGGVLVPGNENHDEASIEETRKAVAGGASILYEAGASNGRIRAWADIMLRDGSAWDMVEVKSTLDYKPTHVQDMSVQKWIFEGDGYRLRKCQVCTLNRDYVRQGGLEIPKLFKLWDVTGEVERLMPDIEGNVKRFLEVADAPETPDIPVGGHCFEPYDCPFMGHCWKDMPEDNVFNLCFDRQKLADALYIRGIREIKDIPPAERLNKPQKLQIEAARSGQTYWDKAWVAEYLARFKVPLQFLDFEADNPAVPRFDGMSPYQKIPFQFSLHVVEGPGAEPETHGFLGNGIDDPRRGLAEELVRCLRPDGSVVAYHAAYERSVLLYLAEKFPDLAEALRSAESRLVDLIVPFGKRKIVHPAFHGSTSLKVVLPALVPGMSYQGMEVADGTAAVASYRKMGEPGLPGAERDRQYRALLDYCAQDTLAMVRLFEVLNR